MGQKFFIKIFFFLNIAVCSTVLLSQQRIVSLTPSITKSLYLLNEKDNVVGITSFCKKISDKQKIVGSYLEFNVEEILKLKPDVIFVSKEGIKKESVEELRKFKLNITILSPVNTYEDIKKQFIQIAKIIKKEDKAKQIISYYESKYKERQIKSPVSILCIIGLHPLIVATDKSYMGDIIRYTGAKNCISHRQRYVQLTPEEIIRFNPDVIIIPDMGINETEVRNFFRQFEELNAVKNNRIFVLPADILCQPNIENFFLSVEKVSKLIK
ncbi:MAG: helical backbone metal receptor [Endomicrobia bacterium]|nr:helical backbone metal receptor [Endomicrobiia bacterium]MDW8056191.1 helical backbone metal receptor [Elusimicrobiota bacterium]